MDKNTSVGPAEEKSQTFVKVSGELGRGAMPRSYIYIDMYSIYVSFWMNLIFFLPLFYTLPPSHTQIC